MQKNINYRLDTLEINSKYFLDSTDYPAIFELINSQEKPIKIYDKVSFSEILVIDRKKNNVSFLMGVMTQTDRKKINKRVDEFINKFSGDGIWLWDLKSDELIYDYQTKKTEGSWSLFCRENYGNYLAMDGDNLHPIKFYNAQNKSAMYWGVYYCNKFLTNPSGSLAEEEGVKIMMSFVCRLYNLEPLENFTYNKQHIINAISIFEKENSHINESFLDAFRKLYTKLISEKQKIIDKKTFEDAEKKVQDVGLALSEKGRIFLSDLVNNKIPETFYLVDIDLVVDKRITGAFVENRILTFATTIALNRRDINEILSMMGNNKEYTEVKSNSELDFLLSAQSQFDWHQKIYGDM